VARSKKARAMSDEGKIPQHLLNDFIGYMEFSEDLGQYDDGFWFDKLEAAARSFIETHGLEAVAVGEAVQLYLVLRRDPAATVH
jgi:hypothetical protein